ncbi:MAG TPA: sulfite exporter TauE/SafE family protein [Myxococcaceae bacterium]
MPSAALGLGAAGLLIGVLIGSTGVGGVLLVPFLVHGLGFQVQSAVAAALWSYLFSGLLAIALYWRRGSIPARSAIWLCAAAIPGAYLGTEALAVVPGKVVEGLIAVVLLLGGLHTLRRAQEPPRSRPPPGPWTLVGLGGVTGFASALLGAGGAFLLVPLLVALGEPVLLAVGLGQAIQVPISAVASVANLRADRIDLAAGWTLAIALSVGIAVGTPLAHGLSQQALRRLVSLAMLVAAVMMIARLTRLF